MIQILVLLFSFSPLTQAAELPAKFERCIYCHEADGRSKMKYYPNLAAQQSVYISYNLHAFRDKTRNDPDARNYMQYWAAKLTDEDIEIVAEYFSALPPVRGNPENPSVVAAGQQIFFRGIPDRKVPVCASCHGAKGQGSGGIPRIAGQHATYLAKQLLWFQNGERSSTKMGWVTKGLTPEDMEAVANFLETL